MLNLVKKSHARGISYRVIFSDFQMPVMDGIEAVRLIREFFKQQRIPKDEQPFIFGVTGHVQEEFLKMGLQAGMDEVISKPVYPEMMKRIIS